MSKQTDAQLLRDITHSLPDGTEREVLERVASQLQYDAKKDEEWQKLQDIGRGAFESIADMVAALECDYDRLEELREERNEHDDDQGEYTQLGKWAIACPGDAEELAELEKAAGDCESREDAEQRIQEDPLSIELTGTWGLGDDTPVADRALILLGTGGPATRIVCELSDHAEPHRAWLEAQDWGTTVD